MLRVSRYELGEQDLLEEEMRINVGGDTLVGLDNLLQINIDKVVEGINMLLDKTLDFEKRRQKLPFVLFAHKKFSSVNIPHQCIPHN